MTIVQPVQQALVFSQGIIKIPHLAQFLTGLNPVPYRHWRQTKADLVLGWGLRPSTHKARRYAKRYKLPYVALEDGFLRSLGLGVEGAAPWSLVYDDLGIYYDCSRPSRLERLILEADLQDLSEAKRALNLILDYGLSKYNQAPDFPLETQQTGRPVVLVVDQTFGDMAIQYGKACAETFQTMLNQALAENPQAEIWLKIHPDVLSGKKQGHFPNLPKQANLRLISEDYNPLSLLKAVDKVYCVTSHLGFEALMLGKRVITFGVPWFAGWGLTEDRHPYAQQLASTARRKERSVLQLFFAAYLQYSRYLDPINQKQGTIFDVIEHLHRLKGYQRALAGDLYCVGLSLWKKAIIKPFFNLPACRLHFVSSLAKLAKQRLPPAAKLLVWGEGAESLLHFATKRKLAVVRMEDGFIRSVGLGSNLVAPLSLVVDPMGIYFNAQAPSGLEYLLQHQHFSPQDLAQAEQLKNQLIASHIGKYNVGKKGFKRPLTDKKVILVTGQVEDDASIRFGSPKIKTNLALLQQVRRQNPQAYIIYKPHPDVVSGNRKGQIAPQQLEQYADLLVTEANVLDCINQVDEVHTLTSLAGFEALIRGKSVHCYGLPFYAGWGLTQDYCRSPRRTGSLQLNELIAATLLYYPCYIDPLTKQFINASRAVEILLQQKAKHNAGRLSRSWLAKQQEKLKQLYSALKQ